MAEPPYTSKFFDAYSQGARDSAEVVVPLVLALLEPRSVCDVGCGRGPWLSVFEQHGVSDICGMDGDYVRREELEIAAEHFISTDLEKGIQLNRRFDLVLSLEVAEHLPESSAARFVDGLVSLAPAVLFSAAIPGQTGIGHVNEQWQGYWQAHFRRHGYRTVDCIRPSIWENQNVNLWYRQNTLLFAEQSLIESRPKLRDQYECSKGRPVSIVHPKMFEVGTKRPWARVRKLRNARDAGRITTEEFEAAIKEVIEQELGS